MRNHQLSLFILFAIVQPMFGQVFVPEQTVFPITDFKPDIEHFLPLSMKFGTGFCLDEDCRFVGTNYHVAKIMGKYVRIKGVFSAHRYLDSGLDDRGAETLQLARGGSMKFNWAHDLAIYEMRYPLKRHNGIGFDTEDLEDSREVDVYAYPFNWNPKRALVHLHGKLIGKNTRGLLVIDCVESQLRGGASGGIVVDRKTEKIVGVLSGLNEEKGNIAFAVPVKELSEFVARVQPYLQANLFPKTVFVSPVAPDLYPPYSWPHNEGLSQARLFDSPEVFKLRLTAQRLANSMRNFTATQTFAWGLDNHETEAADAYETLIVDGQQHWRHPGDAKFLDNVHPLGQGTIG